MAEKAGGGGEPTGRLKLGELLLRHGVVTLEQVHEALKQQKITGKRLGKNLVQLGFLDENTLVRFLATQLNVAAANLNKMEIPPEVQRLVPLEVMLEAGVLPVKVHENTLYLGTTGPLDPGALRGLRLPQGMRVSLVALPQSQWEYAMEFLRVRGWGTETLGKGPAVPRPRRAEPDLRALMEELLSRRGSALYLVPGAVPALRLGDQLVRLDAPALTAQRLEELVLPRIPAAQRARLAEAGQVEVPVAGTLGRFRLTAFRARGELAAALRHVPEQVPTFEELGLPPWLIAFAARRQGLVLVAAPPGHGGGTTLASLVDAVNATRRAVVATLEDPIRYVQGHRLAAVSQREIGSDAPSFHEGVRQALRLDPDVIAVDELADPLVLALALGAVEDGKLVLGRVRSRGAWAALEDLAGGFPAAERPRVRMRLGDALALVLGQRLLPRAGGAGRVLAWERLVPSPAVQAAIRAGGVSSFPGGRHPAGEDFSPLEAALADLARRGEVRPEDALKAAEDAELFRALVRAP
jgi:twitching motility protein PilT